MAWSQDVKVGTAQVALWKKAAQSSTHRINRCVSSDNPVNVQRRVTVFGVKAQKSPDSLVHCMHRTIRCIGRVSQEGVSLWLTKLHSLDDPMMWSSDHSLVIG